MWRNESLNIFNGGTGSSLSNQAKWNQIWFKVGIVYLKEKQYKELMYPFIFYSITITIITVIWLACLNNILHNCEVDHEHKGGIENGKITASYGCLEHIM